MSRPTPADVAAAAADGRRRRALDDAASAQAARDRPARQAAYELGRVRANVAAWRDTQLLARVSNFAWLAADAVEVYPSEFDTTSRAVLVEALELELAGLGLTIERRDDCVALVFA